MAFFRKNKDNQPKLEGKESVVSSSELLSEEQEVANSDEEIPTALSIHPDWNLPKEDVYAFQFLNNECPPLKPNQLSLSGISLIQDSPKSYQVTAFIRNSLDKPIRFEDVTLALLDENDQLLGRKAFNLSNMGEIPPRSSRPWSFVFTFKDLFKTELPQEGWKLAFVIKPKPPKHRLDLDKTWKKSLSKQEIKELEEYVDSLTPPKEGEVNFLGLQAQFIENGDLYVTILIRNGNDEQINIEEIVLQMEDATNEVIAKGHFALGKLAIKGHTSKPWTFIFPKSMITKENPDLSNWKIYIPNN